MENLSGHTATQLLKMSNDICIKHEAFDPVIKIPLGHMILGRLDFPRRSRPSSTRRLRLLGW